jgi:hypothetical protein
MVQVEILYTCIEQNYFQYLIHWLHFILIILGVILLNFFSVSSSSTLNFIKIQFKENKHKIFEYLIIFIIIYIN